MRKLIRVVRLTAVVLLTALALVKSISADSTLFSQRLVENPDTCSSGALTPMAMPPSGTPVDLEVTGACKVPAGHSYHGKGNIFKGKGGTTRGTLTVPEANISFMAN